MSGLLARLGVLLPSWRFFDRAGEAAVLHVRAVGGEWRVVGAPPRTIASWAIAPQGNLALAYQAVIDRMVDEVDRLGAEIADDDPRITGSVTYELVTAIAREHFGGASALQWKITVREDIGEPTDFLTSPELA